MIEQVINQGRDDDRYTYTTADGEMFYYIGEAIKNYQAGTVSFTNAFGQEMSATYDGVNYLPLCELFLSSLI